MTAARGPGTPGFMLAFSIAFILTCASVCAPAFGEPGEKSETSTVRSLVFLSENRPIFVRLRTTIDGRPFENSWMESARILRAALDRDGDGKLTIKEAEEKLCVALARLATGAPAPVPGAAAANTAANSPGTGPFSKEALDSRPQDGTVSVEELAEALRRADLGPFQTRLERRAVGRTDALFDRLDRDKDGVLTRTELSLIVGSLRPLDLDDDETINPLELEPFRSRALAAASAASAERQFRFTAVPAVIELVAGESSLRPARLLFKKYDRAPEEGRGRPDHKLSPEEFAIDPDVFARFDDDGDHDGFLNTSELRALLASGPVDVALEAAFQTAPNGQTTAAVRPVPGAALGHGARLRQFPDGSAELIVGDARLDIQADPGNGASAQARSALERLFKRADVNKNGYLEEKERARLDTPGAPLAGLSSLIDRDHDGKIDLKEVLDFGDRQFDAARRRLTLTTIDQGRAIFGILDLDRDQRLDRRETLRAVDRVLSWDGDGDGRVSAAEVPDHFQITIARGETAGLTDRGTRLLAPQSVTASRSTNAHGDAAAPPVWFQKMDRNHDGDVSHREFLGPREQFERLDRDHDGLIDADEARAAARPHQD